MESIEDLIKTSQGEIKEESTQEKFLKEEEKIRLKSIEKATAIKANDLNVPYVDLFGFPVSPEALILIPKEDSKRLKIVCFYYDGSQLRLGCINPEDKEIQNLNKELSEKYFCKSKIYLISQNSLDYAIRVYDAIPEAREIISGVEIKEEDIKKFEKDIKNYKSLDEKINKVNISDTVTLILATAMKTGASDIHIEAEEKNVAIRLRIDGVLQEAATIKKNQWKKIISRMKLLARVKINIADKPQDGRFTIFLDNEKIAIRSSFLPTAFGESVVMRLLRSKSIKLSFENLGFNIRQYEILGKEMIKPNGLILTTGPTGSGKTTTLYSVLNKLNQPETKIITLEDPIEYQLKGINQSQVNSKKKYTFATGLRSILRQDPDIIMVGEIRDLETAEITVQASLTGHLVLSTLHTNDSSGVIPRLLDMGVKPYFLTPSINAIIGQRLVRKLCPKCKIEHSLDEKEEEKVKKIIAVISPKANINAPRKLPTFYSHGKGCENCNGIGYKGRVGIYEIMNMAKNIKELIAQKAPAFKILEQSIENGMITMLQDGILKCLKGITSLKEVYRVIGKTDYIDALYDIALSKSLGANVKISEKESTKVKSLVKDLKTAQDALLKITPGESINLILGMAIKINAGDIHIEPTDTAVKVRFRIDGIMTNIADMPKDYYLPILSQIKIFAGFPTNVKKASWDGRFGIKMEDRKIDCRISIISGGYGETIVIRVLSSQASSLDMKNLGICGNTFNIINKSISKTKGIVITTGPTGSGKTTTLYSILNKLNDPNVKIITIEDPIEYHLEGIMQTQIEGDYTFASAMRSLLRQNPNIIMVGEIRDSETAKIAIEAAMTGHLVLSTIHANSAAGAISRFVGLGLERQILASSLESTIGQRLLRKLCPHCKEQTKLAPDVLSEVKNILDSINPAAGVKIPELIFYKSKGCHKCSNIGYKGRIGIYEAIDMTVDVQKIIQKEAVTETEIEEAAMANGTILMMQDGILKALGGETTVSEVFRVAK